MSNLFSCIVPAFNEEQRIAGVLRVVNNYKFFSEIIIVDDGSTDKTSQIIKKFPKIKLLRHKENLGKAAAVLTGVKNSKGKFIVLLDADLVNLTHQNLNNLIRPVLKNKCMTISRRANAFPLLGQKIAIFSGERVVNKKIFDKIQNHYHIGYALEAFINREVLRANYKFKSVPWPNVKYVRKQNKDHQKFWHEFKMLWSIYSHFPIWEALFQQIYIPFKYGNN